MIGRLDGGGLLHILIVLRDEMLCNGMSESKKEKKGMSLQAIPRGAV